MIDFEESDEPETESGRAPLVATHDKVDVDRDESTAEDNAFTVESEIDTITLDSNDDGDSTHASTTHPIVVNHGPVVDSASATEQVNDEVESEVNMAETPKTARKEDCNGDVFPQITDNDVSAESPDMKELIILAGEPLDDPISAEYYVGRTAENRNVNESCTASNVSVDLLENGRLVAKTEIEIEMETDYSNMNIKTISNTENDLQAIKRGILNDNETTTNDAYDKSGAKKVNEKDKAKKKLKPKLKRHRSTAVPEKDDARYLLPFSFGWKRELVLRSGPHFKRGDVYYYTPDGRKLRAMPKVLDYLKANNIQNLTMENFTYSMRSFDSPHASTRQAVAKGSKNTTIDNKNLRLCKTAVPPSKVSSPATSQPAKKKRDLSQYPHLRRAKCKITGRFIKGIVGKMEAPSAQPPTSQPATVNIPVEIPKTPVLPPPQPSPSPLNKASETRVTCANDASLDNCDTEMEMIKLCTNMCSGQEGVIPSLHCNKCLCLFHPRCVGISDSFAASSNFTCQECGGGEVILRKELQSLVKISVPQDTSQWTVNNFPFAPPQPPTSTQLPHSNGYGKSILKQPQPPQWTSVPVPSSDCEIGTVKRFSCGVTIEKVRPGFNICVPSELPSVSISVIPVSPAPPVYSQSVNSVDNSERNTVPSSIGESPRSILRPVVIPTSNSAFPLLKNAIMKFTKPVRPPVDRRVHTHKGQFNRIFNDVRPTQQKLSPEGLLLLKNTCDSRSGPSSTRAPAAKNLNGPSIVSSTPTVNNTRSASATPEPVNQSNTVNSLNCGILSLISIFKYLGTGDLLRAAQVCRAWRLLARHPAAWEAISLKDVLIKDWAAFVKIVQTFGTRHLDTSGMLVTGSRSSAFHGFVNAVNKLKNLESLTLGETPPEIVHATITRLPQLRHFAAEWIMNFNKNDNAPCEFSGIGNIATMPQLKVLRLRGFHGLSLLRVNSGLQRLSNLQQLTCLAITSLQDVPASEFEFLYKLQNLTTLELGNCTHWTKSIYVAISLMKHLKKLRLEFGGIGSECGIQTILQTLTNLIQLELIIFRIPPNFGDLLSRLRNLRQLTVWPDLKHNPMFSNFYSVKATTQITFVKTMMWGLVISHLKDPNSSGPGQVNHNSCCIPFLNADPAIVQPNPSTYTYISAHELMNKLRAKMPHSKVQVIMVPNEASSTICYMPR